MSLPKPGQNPPAFSDPVIALSRGATRYVYKDSMLTKLETGPIGCLPPGFVRHSMELRREYGDFAMSSTGNSLVCQQKRPYRSGVSGFGGFTGGASGLPSAAIG